MTDAWTTLGLTAGADSEAVRKRYLELVRQHPPERDPARFAEVHAAYESLRDPLVRLQSELFSIESERTVDDILAQVRARIRNKRIRTDVLLSLGQR